MSYWPYSVVEEGCITTQKVTKSVHYRYQCMNIRGILTSSSCMIVQIHECVRGCVAKFGSSRALGRRCSISCVNLVKQCSTHACMHYNKL